MAVAVVSRHQHVKVGDIFVINEGRYLCVPVLERLVLLGIKEVVVAAALLRDLCALEELSDRIIKSLL